MTSSVASSARHVADCSSDDGASLLERQRSQRSARAFTSRETGMTVLNGQFDPIVGARITTAIDAAAGQLFRRQDPNSRTTPAQRTADAIAQLICEPDTARPAGTSLVLVADYDAVNQQLANGRLANGTPVPISEIAKIAVNAGVLPVIFDKATGELRMGRRRRSATELQRSALAVRDQGCVGCGAAPELCRAHHIVEWQHGGVTDLDNLVSVCHHCHHHKIHHDGFTVERDPDTGRYRLRPPDKPRPNNASPTTRPSATQAPAKQQPNKQPAAKPRPARQSTAKEALGTRPPAERPLVGQLSDGQRSTEQLSAKQLPAVKPITAAKRPAHEPTERAAAETLGIIGASCDEAREPTERPAADTDANVSTTTRAPPT